MLATGAHLVEAPGQMPGTVGNSAIEELPLHLLLWIAGRGRVISEREIQAFLCMLDQGGWCQSRWARENLHRARESNSDGWNASALSGLNRDLDTVQSGLRSLRKAVTFAEAGQIRDDLVRLAEAIARASGGILGAAAMRREQREALLVFSVLATELMLVPDERLRPPSPESVGAAPAAATEARLANGQGRISVRCVQVIAETSDVKTFRLVAPASNRFTHHPGQFLTLDVTIDGDRFKRSYTIASSPSRPEIIEITVKRVPGGRVSNWLHDHFGVGDEVTITGPAGKFGRELGGSGAHGESGGSRLTSDKLLYISGGSGITPVMSMSRYLHDRADQRDVVFLHSARTAGDLVFADELRLISRRHTGFRTFFTLTEAEPQNWSGLRGRITLSTIEDAVPDFRDRTVFLCGPTPFMEAVRQALVAGDFPLESFHSESFGGPSIARSTKSPEVGEVHPEPVTGASAHPRPSSFRFLGVLPRPTNAGRSSPEGSPSPAPVTSQSPVTADAGAVVFRSSGQEARACKTETILEAAEALGLSIPSSCRAGVCGTCKTRKVSGNVSMDCDDGLDPEDRSAGFILPCTARPLDRVTVEA